MCQKNRLNKKLQSRLLEGIAKFHKKYVVTFIDFFPPLSASEPMMNRQNNPQKNRHNFVHSELKTYCKEFNQERERRLKKRSTLKAESIFFAIKSIQLERKDGDVKDKLLVKSKVKSIEL